jgi:hypothetical protein
MNRSNLILTHGAVFSVGIAAAMIANSFRDTSNPAAAAIGGSTSRSRLDGAGRYFEKDSSTPSSRANGEDSRTRSKKENAPAVERLASLVRITDPFERQRALMDMIDTLGPGEFASVAEQYRQLDHLGDSRGEFDLILRGWAKADPLAALEYAGSQPNTRNTSATILSTWAANDPAGAERWALAHHDGEGANPFLPSVIRGIAATDVPAASRLAQTLPLSRERAEAVDGITRALFLQGNDAAMAFPETIPDEALRGGFVAAIADRMVEKDPTKAAAWVAAMGQGEIQNRAARTVADALAKTDTKAAASWVEKLKPEAQAEAARGVIPVMSSADITGTAKWVSGLVGTPGYDKVVEEFVWSCNTRAPEQSAAWIQGVSDPNQQRRLYYRMLGEWARKDAAAVKQWVAANNVPDDIRRRYLR